MDKLNSQISLLNEIKLLESQISQIIHYSEEAIISTDDNFNIILFNNGAEKIFGYNAKEIIGQKLNTLIPQKLHSIHDQHMSEFSQYQKHAQIMGNKRLVLGVHKEGHEFNVEASVTIVTIGEKKVYTAFLRDITLRLELEKELFVAKEKFESVIRIANDAIISIDESHNIIIFNQGAEKIFGYSEQEIIGKPIDILIPTDLRKSHSKHISEFSNRPNHSRMMAERQEIFGLRKDGIEFHAEASIANVKIEGKPLYTVILRDVTSRKLLEKQLIKYLDSLEKINDEKEKYISMLAHDLRNPFGSLMGNLDYLKKNLDNLKKDEIHEILSSSIASASNIYNLLESMLEWARIQMNRISFQPKYLNVSSELEPVIALYKSITSEKNITVDVDLPEEGIIFADPNMLATVFRNLLSNAVKFSYANGVIRIRCSTDSDYLSIHISDEGTGMKDEVIRKLFRTDQDIHKEGTEGEKGAGIGLLLVKDFVEINAGMIKVESKESVGTVVSVSLPIKPMP